MRTWSTEYASVSATRLDWFVLTGLSLMSLVIFKSFRWPHELV